MRSISARQTLVRRAKGADAEVLAGLAVRAVVAGAAGLYSADEIGEWAGKFSAEMILERIETKFFVVLEEESFVVGFGALGVGPGEIDLVYVDPRFGGRGYGAAIMGALMSELRLRGEAKAWLDSSRNAVPFYESCGFLRSECGETKGGLCLRMEREV